MVHKLIGSVSLVRIMQEATQQKILSLFTKGFWDSRSSSFTHFEHYHKVVVTVRPRRLQEKRYTGSPISWERYCSVIDTDGSEYSKYELNL